MTVVELDFISNALNSYCDLGKGFQSDELSKVSAKLDYELDNSISMDAGYKAMAADKEREEQDASHDKWFREQVELALKEADDPNTVWINNEQSKSTTQDHRDRLLLRINRVGANIRFDDERIVK
jgi:hypothetical protein